MNPNNNIQDELKELNSILAGIPARNVYSVPDGYFEASTDDILMAVLDRKPVAHSNENIPEGYFEELAGSIMNRIKGISDLEEKQDENPAFLRAVKNTNVYAVPSGYFENLSSDIIVNITSSEETVLEPAFLSQARGINVYHIPQGYFEGLSDRIMKELPVTAKVVGMSRSFSIFRYAVAAVISGIVGLSVISVLNDKDTRDTGSRPSTVMAQANNILQTNSFDQVLSTVQDEDIVNYLQQSGEDVNAALAASFLDDNNLPDQLDYLTDDKTLEKLLNGLTVDQLDTN